MPSSNVLLRALSHTAVEGTPHHESEDHCAEDDRAEDDRTLSLVAAAAEGAAKMAAVAMAAGPQRAVRAALGRISTGVSPLRFFPNGRPAWTPHCKS